MAWNIEQPIVASVLGVRSRQQVADRSFGLADARYSGVTNWTTKTKHLARVACSALRLVYSGHYSSSGLNAELPLDNAVDLKIAVETADGKIIPVRWGVNRTLTLNPGQLAVSDPVGISLAAGDTFWLRVYQNKGAGTYTYSNTTIRGASEATGEGHSAAVDYADSGTIPQSDYVGFLPAAILGDVPASARNGLLCIGDSIMRGSNDLPEVGGFSARAFAANYPAAWLAVGGEYAQYFADAGKRYSRLAAVAETGPRIAVCNYGTNDLAGGRSLAQVQADLTAIWTLLTNMGCRVFQCTILPRPASTSTQWTTLAGQTVAAWDANRTALNDWMRTLPAPLVGYLETADAVESARGSGKWAVPGTFGWTGNANANGTSATALTAAGSPGWTVNAFRGHTLRNVTAGTAAQIRSNTATALTLDASFTWLSADTLEIWATNTRDGIHPSAVGHAAMAAAVTGVTLLN